MYYRGGFAKIEQDVTTNPNIVFETVNTTMSLKINGIVETSTDARYFAEGWQTFGSGNTDTSMELLPAEYRFRVFYNTLNELKIQDIGVNPNVIFDLNTIATKEAIEKSKFAPALIGIYPNPFSDYVNISFNILSEAM